MAESEVPLISIKPYLEGDAEGSKKVIEQIKFAGEKVGFMMICDHGVPQDIIDENWKATRAYFDLPREKKMEVPMSKDYMYGYSGFEDETLAAGIGMDRGADLKESFALGPPGEDRGVPPRKRYTGLDEFQNASDRYYNAIVDLADKLLEIFALAMNLDKDWFKNKTDKHASALRALNYPALTEVPKPGTLRASEHTDYGTVTILLQENAPGGLQVLNKGGTWQDVQTPPGAFVVNIGDLFQRWTNDLWKSTMHRVVLPPEDLAAQARRQSIAFFQNINADAIVECIPTCLSKSCF
mmetsp:Transcript_43450/g.113107  ORF Transcript_43450/g.113107 Transcript_43450/m.113107 type:complete len:296 (-) Transcript_43450:1363-2250(-)